MEKFKEQILKPYLSDNIYAEMNIDNLIKMYEKSLRERKEIHQYFNIIPGENMQVILTPVINKKIKKHQLRVIFEELCYTIKVTHDEVINYLTQLDTRIKSIEETIDSHFNLIKDLIVQRKREQIERKIKKDDDDMKNMKKSQSKLP